MARHPRARGFQVVHLLEFGWLGKAPLERDYLAQGPVNHRWGLLSTCERVSMGWVFVSEGSGGRGVPEGEEGSGKGVPSRPWDTWVGSLQDLG